MSMNEILDIMNSINSILISLNIGQIKGNQLAWSKQKKTNKHQANKKQTNNKQINIKQEKINIKQANKQTKVWT